MSFKPLEHTCCKACRTGDRSGLPEKDMDGGDYDCGCQCEACWLEGEADPPP